MKFEVGKTYITRGGQKATIKDIKGGALIGQYEQGSGKMRSTVWGPDGQHSTRKGKADITGVYPEAKAKVVEAVRAVHTPRPQDASAAQFIVKTPADPRLVVTGFVAVVANEPGAPYPYFKSHPFTNMDALDRWINARDYADVLLRVVEIKEVRLVWEAA